MSDMITISVSLWDSGCLPNILDREIERVERRLYSIGVIPQQFDAVDRTQFEAYLGQLKACKAAVRAARSEAIS